MATITATDMTGSEDRAVNVTTLAGGDTFTYNSTKNPVLIFNNESGGSITPNLVGDAADATYPVQRVGDIDLSTGFDMASISDGTQAAIPLNSIGAYLAGSTVTVTGASGAEAILLEF